MSLLTKGLIGAGKFAWKRPLLTAALAAGVPSIYFGGKALGDSFGSNKGLANLHNSAIDNMRQQGYFEVPTSLQQLESRAEQRVYSILVKRAALPALLPLLAGASKFAGTAANVLGGAMTAKDLAGGVMGALNNAGGTKPIPPFNPGAAGTSAPPAARGM